MEEEEEMSTQLGVTGVSQPNFGVSASARRGEAGWRGEAAEAPSRKKKEWAERKKAIDACLRTR